MILQLSALCLSILQTQQPQPAIDVDQSGFSLRVESISSEDVENGIKYTLGGFELSTESLSLKAQSAIIEIDRSPGALGDNSGWSASLLRGLGLNGKDVLIRSIAISDEVVFVDDRFTITADKLNLRPLESISEFINVRAVFASNTIGPNGWPVLITAEELLEFPNGELEFRECTFSTCLDEPQHYSMSFELLRVTKSDNDKMLWQPESAWLNIYGLPIIPLPAPDFVDGDDFFGLKSINFGSSRITGNAIIPKFGGRTVIDGKRGIEWNVSPGYSDLRGLPLYLDFDYRGDGFTSKFNAFYLNDRAQDFHRLGESISRTNSQRYLVDWHNHWQLDENWSFNAELSLSSDHLVTPEFFRREWLNNDDSISSLELFRRGSENYFAAIISVPTLSSGYTPIGGFGKAPNPQGQYLSYLPYTEYLSYAIAGNGALPNWLSTSWGASAGRLKLQDYGIASATASDFIENQNAERDRVAVWATAAANISFNGMHIVPEVTIRSSAWRDTLPVTLSDQQLYIESSLSSNAIFIQHYPDGWSHKIIPSVSLRAQHAMVSADGMPDNFDGADALQEGRLLEFGVRQFFYAPNAERPWLDMQLLQPYYLSSSSSLGSSLMPFRRATLEDGLGPSELRMKWTPSVHGKALKGMSVLFNVRYDFELDRADEVVSQISMRPDSNYFYGLNYLEVNGTTQDFSLGSAYAGLRISEEWSASMRKSRNFSGDAGLFSTWEATHYAHDFSIEVGYTLVESTGADGFYFSITPRFVHDKFNSHDFSLRNIN